MPKAGRTTLDPNAAYLHSRPHTISAPIITVPDSGDVRSLPTPRRTCQLPLDVSKFRADYAGAQNNLAPRRDARDPSQDSCAHAVPAATMLQYLARREWLMYKPRRCSRFTSAPVLRAVKPCLLAAIEQRNTARPTRCRGNRSDRFYRGTRRRHLSADEIPSGASERSRSILPGVDRGKSRWLEGAPGGLWPSCFDVHASRKRGRTRSSFMRTFETERLMPRDKGCLVTKCYKRALVDC